MRIVYDNGLHGGHALKAIEEVDKYDLPENNADSLGHWLSEYKQMVMAECKQ